ncbi:hypothetical protein ACMD2_20598 [Ananas comosus]|uniref:Uncharacterized protein n=1 Tax=Ananas comosus TaxID=4615 RepID=A0A199VTK6_ANACO|nr:hypothetical protein ACMD2_20598 [Ananas comosus]
MASMKANKPQVQSSQAQATKAPPPQVKAAAAKPTHKKVVQKPQETKLSPADLKPLPLASLSLWRNLEFTLHDRLHWTLPICQTQKEMADIQVE